MGYSDPAKQKSYLHEHYVKNKQLYYSRSRSRLTTLRSFIQEIKEKNSCHDCKEFYPYFVMEFDHRDSELKIMEISTLMKEGGLVSILKEIQKCDIVCANCHRYRGHHRRSL